MADQRRNPEQRPSPEALLEAARREEGRVGKLRIFVGAAPGVGKRTAERIVVELREKVGASLPEQAISVTRAESPRALAREGLLGLGYSSPEADELLDGAEGERPEDLIAHALRTARR